MTEPYIPEQYPEDEFEYTEDNPPRRGRTPEPETAEAMLKRRAERVEMESLLRGILEKKISEAVDKAIGGRIEKEVAAIFEEGWVATNQWGEDERGGQRVNIRDRISSLLSEKEDGYNRRCTSVVSIIKREIKESVKPLVEAEGRAFKEELKKWKKEKMTERLRQAIDGAIF